MTTSASCTTATHPHFRRIPAADLRKAWLDPSRKVDDIAAHFKLSPRALRVRVRAIGLELRTHDTKLAAVTPEQEALFSEAWRAGVGGDELAEYFRVTRRTISNTRKRLGLPNRIPGTRPKTTMAQLAEARLAAAMAITARREQAALIGADMADRLGSRRQVGFLHVTGRPEACHAR